MPRNIDEPGGYVKQTRQTLQTFIGRQHWDERIRPGGWSRELEDRPFPAPARFQLLCRALLDWLEDQGYNDLEADAILRQIIDRADEYA